jgi:hypothetical protein
MQERTLLQEEKELSMGGEDADAEQQRTVRSLLSIRPMIIYQLYFVCFRKSWLGPLRCAANDAWPPWRSQTLMF